MDKYIGLDMDCKKTFDYAIVRGRRCPALFMTVEGFHF